MLVLFLGVMKVSSSLSLSLNTHHFFNHKSISSPFSIKTFYHFPQNSRPKFSIDLTFTQSSKNFPTFSCFAIAEALETITDPPTLRTGDFNRFDKSGRFSSSRAARELALLIVYASCLEASDPVCLFDKRLDAKIVPGYVFDKDLLLQYDHMRFAGEPAQVENKEAVDELRKKDENVLEIEAHVLSAPPKLVYNKFVLRLARDLLKAVVDKWNEHALSIDKISPKIWKDKPSARILEHCILHLAMAEITAVGTPYPIVINEAVDLSKRFCDGYARPIINGCLRTFVGNIGEQTV